MFREKNDLTSIGIFYHMDSLFHCVSKHARLVEFTNIFTR